MRECGNKRCAKPATVRYQIHAGDLDEDGEPVKRIYYLCEEHKYEIRTCGVLGCDRLGELRAEHPGTHPENGRPIVAVVLLCKQCESEAIAGETLKIDSPIPLSIVRGIDGSFTPVQTNL